MHTVVNGISGTDQIAESFKGHFVKVSQPNNQSRVNELDEAFRREYDKANDAHSNCTCAEHKITLENVLDASFSLKKAKCPDNDKISAEHLFNAPLMLFDRMQALFSKMLNHGFVPFMWNYSPNH